MQKSYQANAPKTLQKMETEQRKTERQHLTAVWRNGGFSASYDSFVVKQTVVLRINICGKNPPLRQAANRWHQALKDTKRLKQTEEHD